MILITGATGFVGQALIADLTERGVTFSAASRNERPGYYAVGDITPHTNWAGALEGATAVIHLAARVHVMSDTSANPIAEYRRANVHATTNLARQAAAAGVRRFVFVSSIKVNGEATHPGVPFTEADEPAPVDPYGQSKLEAEQALFKLGEETGLEIVVVRPPLVYGPGVKANFAAMFAWVERGIPLPLGAVNNRRSMVYVRNLTSLLLTCIDHPRASGEVFLAADGEDVSTTTLLVKMAAALGKPSRLIPIPATLLQSVASLLGKSAIAQRLLGSLQVSTTKANTALGWRAPYNMNEGLGSMVRQIQKQ